MASADLPDNCGKAPVPNDVKRAEIEKGRTIMQRKPRVIDVPEADVTRIPDTSAAKLPEAETAVEGDRRALRKALIDWEAVEKFYRADANMTRGVSGSGLGLYISRELVNRMGGTITVQSRLGEGSTFVVTLPLAPPAAPAN